ncbi:MAG: helix-turn-helix domain-containing protein [Clostridiaceae bacterium]
MIIVTLEESLEAVYRCVFNGMCPEQAFNNLVSLESRRDYRKASKLEALQMIGNGYSANSIAKELGLPTSTVKYWRKKLIEKRA